MGVAEKESLAEFHTFSAVFFRVLSQFVSSASFVVLFLAKDCIILAFIASMSTVSFLVVLEFTATDPVVSFLVILSSAATVLMVSFLVILESAVTVSTV